MAPPVPMEETLRTMATIFGALYGSLLVAAQVLRRPGGKPKGTWLPPATAAHASKRAGELLCLYYSPLWILAVAVVIALSSYEQWGEWSYMIFCAACALPLLVLPLALPSAADRKLPWHERYIIKANLWVAIFSFIGNYWYTHYFYRVLRADYTFPAHRLNDVPVCLYLMTHAYFMFYHVLSNMALRYVRTAYVEGVARTVFETLLVLVMSYTTAFMESLTICGFPYYKFENVHMAYTLGSAFYALYFVVSFPMFLRVDEAPRRRFTLFQTAVESLASSMTVLCLLDFVRLYVDVPLFTAH